MKIKTLVIQIFIFLLIPGIFAQNIDLGVKTGFVRSMERTNNELFGQDYKSISNYELGLLLGITPFRKIGVQIEPGITAKGSNHYIPQIWTDNNYRLTYYSMPVLLDYKIIRNLHILAGPEFSYLLKTTRNGKEDTYAEELYDKPLEIGIQGGFSYKFLKKVYLGIKYYYGLTPTSETPIVSEAGITEAGSFKTYNKGLIFNIGYILF